MCASPAGLVSLHPLKNNNNFVIIFMGGGGTGLSEGVIGSVAVLLRYDYTEAFSRCHHIFGLVALDVAFEHYRVDDGCLGRWAIVEHTEHLFDGFHHLVGRWCDVAVVDFISYPADYIDGSEDVLSRYLFALGGSCCQQIDCCHEDL
jgi:hypothetical protein